MNVLRELKIKLSFDGNLASELKKTNSEVDALKAKFQPLVDKLPPGFAKAGDEAANLNEQLKKTDQTLGRLRRADGKFLPKIPKIPPMPELDKSASAMAELAKATGHSQATLQKLIDSTKKEMHLEEQFKKAASAVGLTEKEVDKLNSKLKNAEASTANFVNVFKGLAALGVTAAAFSFANKAIDESNRAENALIGFKTVVKNTLGEGQLASTTKGVEDLFKKLGGSMDMSTIQMSVKNLLNSGFSAQQALDLVEKNAYMASVNRQGQFKTIGEAVQVYTEGIKNNNAMLTDSTGISENLSVTLKKKGLSMDDLNNKSKRALVLQEIYNAHTKEASAYQGAYTQQMQGYQGQVIKANSAMSKILETTGNFIKSGLTPLLAIANPVMGFFSDSERGAGRTAMALTLLTTAIGVGLVSATWSWVASLNAVAIAKAVAFAEIIGIALAIAAAITAVYLVFEDIFVFLEYGPAASETFFGDLLRWLGLGEVELQALSDGFHNFKTVMGEVWDSIGTKISNFIESISNAFAWAKENSRLFGAVAVSALVVLSPLLIEIGAAAFATGVEMVAAFLSASIQASISFVAMQLGYIKLAATALWAGGQMAVAWLIGLGPIGWAGLAIAALAGIVFYYWNEISAKTTGLWAGIGNAFDNGVKWIVTKWDSIKQSFSKLIKWMQSAFWDTVEFIKKAAILAGKLLLTYLFPLAGLYLFKDEIKAVFEWLWNLFKNTDIGKFFIDSFLSMKATLSASLSGIFESAKTAFMGLIPTDALNMMIDSINWVLEKLNEFSSSKVASALGMDPLNLQMIAHIQAREMGGPIEAGIPYIVGEKGPELRTFSQSGSIIPNNKMNDYQPAGSGGSISILVNAVINSGAEVANIATDLLSEIEKALEDNKNSIREKFGLTPRYA